MIRSVIALFAFAVALCAYIVTRPPETSNTALEIADLASVSRAQTETLLPDTPLPAAPVAASEGLNLVPDSLAQSVDIILADLGIKAASGDDPLAAQSNAVLAEIGQVTGAVATTNTTFESLIVQALDAAQSDREIYRDVNAAALAERFPVPASLVDTSGQIDIDVLLDIIVNEAQIAAGRAVSERYSPAQGSVVQLADGGATYTVAEGDSLARIAKMFYRDPMLHVDIWAANLDVLSLGYQVNVGQTLFIP